MTDAIQFPSYENIPVTAHSLLNKALSVSLAEYGDYHLPDIRTLYSALVYIRISLEPAFIKDESQLKNVYNKLRESPDPITRRQSDIPMRFLNTVLSRWLVFVADELGTNPTHFKSEQAQILVGVLTIQEDNHARMEDIMGDTMSKKDWLDWLVACPIFILIFNLKYLASDYILQTHDLVMQFEAVKDSSAFIPEG